MHMPPTPDDIVELIRNSHLFRKLDETQLNRVAASAEVVSLSRSQILYHEGASADHIYIVYSGKIRVSRRKKRRLQVLSMLVPGDYFGEEALDRFVHRHATVTAMEDTFLLRLTRDCLQALYAEIPALRLNLRIAASTRRLAEGTRLDWLNPDESVYLLARKHSIFLTLSMGGPVGLMLLSFFLIGLLGAGIFPVSMVIMLIIGGMYLASLAWIIWDVFDFRNDYSVVTNQRVVALEKMIGIYDSRQEAPLSTLLSVTVRTSQMGRWLGYGDVLVRTFTGTMTLKRVAHPDQVASLIEEHWRRVKLTRRKAETTAMGHAIRQRLGFEPSDEGQDSRIQETPITVRPGFLQGFFADIFHVRFDDGQTVTYRKHWFILFRNIWMPFFWMGVSGGILLLRLAGFFTSVSPVLVLAAAGAIFTGMALWALYRYVDWRNDLYQVTPEQIIDLERKPLGKEERKAAPLDNVLSIEYERIGLAGLLLNFGTVTLMVGNTPFTFDHVYNPSLVQQDIFRRMTERLQKKQDAEAAAERERVSEWIALYHESIRGTQNIVNQDEGGVDEVDEAEMGDWESLE